MDIPYAEVIGDPIAHSKSPLIHKFWLGKLGIQADYRATRVGTADLAGYLEARRADPLWRGCNLTMPLKTRAVELADRPDSEALAAGSANCLLPGRGGFVARNSDASGVGAAIRRAVDVACVIGCGGAARAAIAHLEALATPDVRLIVRDPAKGAALLDSFGFRPNVSPFEGAGAIMRNVDCVVNATPLGMTDHPKMPEQVLSGLERTTRDALVFDMVYAPLETELLQRARSLRREAIDGLVMLVGQAAAAFQWFFVAEPPRRYDAELRDLLTS